MRGVGKGKRSRPGRVPRDADLVLVLAVFVAPGGGAEGTAISLKHDQVGGEQKTGQSLSRPMGPEARCWAGGGLW